MITSSLLAPKKVKRLKNNDYWLERREYVYDQAIHRLEVELAKEYRRSAEEVKIKIMNLYDQIKDEEDEVLISHLYKYNRYYDLLNNMNAVLAKLGMKEIKLLKHTLHDFYLTNSQLVVDELGFNMSIDENAVEKVIERVWAPNGKHWSSSVWSNKNGLSEKVQRGLIDCVARGASRTELSEMLMNTFSSVGFYEADRLARTELSYIQNQAIYDRYIQAGIEQYKFLATSDAVVAPKGKGKTCSHCNDQDEEVYALKDAKVGINYPPLHPHCRCSVLAIVK